MNLDDARREWQSHDHGTIRQVDIDVVLADLRRKESAMDRAILHRDYTEIGLAVGMATFWLYGAIRWEKTLWFVTAFGCLFVAMFLFLDRWIRRRRHPACDSTLAACLDSSLDALHHQTWLLRNVFWWYLLPLWLGMAAFAVSLFADKPTRSIGDCIGSTVAIMIFTLVFVWVYRLNQKTVLHVLTPRSHELHALKVSLEREP